MNTEHAVIRLFAWLALALYVSSQALLRRGRYHVQGAWWFSAAGWAALILHSGDEVKRRNTQL